MIKDNIKKILRKYSKVKLKGLIDLDHYSILCAESSKMSYQP